MRSVACVLPPFAAAAILLPATAAAQEEEAVVPPRLLEIASTPLPAGTAVPPEGPPAVVLELTVTVDGSAADVTVVEGVSVDLDRIAVEAVLAARFEPARRSGEPIAARIRYRHGFDPPPAPETPPPPHAQPPQASPPSPVATPDRAPARGDLPEDEEDSPIFEATAVVEAPPREVTRHTLDRQEMLTVPGTRGDPLRAVELLPGVGRPAFGTGDLIVRGSAPQDSQILLEGNPVPLLYHFGGLTSFFQGRLLERIDFYPGNFGVRYGGRVGGMVDVSVRDPATDRFHGMLDVNLIDASIVMEAPIGERFAFAVAARRSYVDSWIGAVIPNDVRITAAPVYWDYQAIAAYRPTSTDTFRLRAYGSNDRFALIFSEPGDDPTFRGDLSTTTRFHHVELSWERRMAGGVEQEMSISVGPTDLEFDVGPQIHFDWHYTQVNSRAEWRMPLGERTRLIAGLDVVVSPFDIVYRGPLPPQMEGMGADVPVGSQETVDVDASDLMVRPGAYVELDVDLPPLRIVAGVRADYFGLIEAATVDPRLSLFVDVAEQTRLKAGVGLFSQAPEFNESSPQVGNPELDPIRAVHTSVGLEQEVPELRLSFGVEGFYKYLWDRVVATDDGLGSRFTNDGIGRIYGLELSARMRPGGLFYGFLSYTLSRSERRDLPGDPWRLFDSDQTHILTASGTFALGRGWTAGATFRLVTGNPTTPVVDAVYDVVSDLYLPVSGPVNSDRNDMFHRLDLRIEKTWRFQPRGSFSVYLDVQNVYNRQNPEGVTYNYDYSQSGVATGLPIIPSIGIRGEL